MVIHNVDNFKKIYIYLQPDLSFFYSKDLNLDSFCHICTFELRYEKFVLSEANISQVFLSYQAPKVKFIILPPSWSGFLILFFLFSFHILGH